MYRANPRVNVELRQRLPSPDRGTKDTEDTWTQAPHLLQDLSIPCSPSPPSYRRSVSPPVSPLLMRRSVSPPVSPPSSRTPGGVGTMEEERFPSRGPSPRAESCRDEGGASRGAGSPSVRRHLVPGGDSPRLVSASTLDRDKNVSLLLKELDALREINVKLQEQLVQKEKEVQSREVEEELREEQREARDWGRAAVVLEEVLAAQKDRDQAVMSRLLLANQERDEALTLARRLQEAAQSEDVDLDNSDTDVEELLRCICDANSVQEVQQFGSVLVQRLRLARQRRHDITAQEMKAVMEERDESVAKCKLLEHDLVQERRPVVSEEELLRLQRERDRAVEDRRQMEAELQELRANHSPQDRVQNVYQMASVQAPPPQGHLPQSPPPQPPALLVQLQQLSQEKQSVEAELQRCQEAEQEANERVRRLERLVEVLRKKVGTGSLRSVI